MTFKINGTELVTPSTTDGWVSRELLGRDGNGRPIYTPTRQFQMNWGTLGANEYNTLQDYYLGIGVTGSVIVDLPVYTSGSYSFQSYTGCYINEPTFTGFFSEHYMNVNLLITNIITEK